MEYPQMGVFTPHARRNGHHVRPQGILERAPIAPYSLAFHERQNVTVGEIKMTFNVKIPKKVWTR